MRCFMICAAYAAFAVHAQPSSNAFLHLLTNAAAQSGAVCLDGSPAAYYYRPGAESKKFFIHTQGGGVCQTDDDCYSRSLTALGSSKTYPAVGTFVSEGYFSTNPSINPLMHNWTLLYIPYCDGAFQMGEREAPRQIAGKGTIYIRGHRIKTALMNEFLTNTTIGLSAATDIVVGGCSAGAVSTWLFADSWAAAVPSAKTVALPDSGFFIRFDPSPTKNFTENLLELVAYQNGTIALPQACLTGHPTPSLCIFPQEISPYLKTPYFALQSEYDAWQLANELPNQTASLINWYGGQLTSLLQSKLLASNPNHGTFLDSCDHHCDTDVANGVNMWNSMLIDGDTQATAFSKWYAELGTTGAKKLWRQGKAYPCAACCTGAGRRALRAHN